MKKSSAYACIIGAATLWGLIGTFSVPLLASGFSSASVVAARAFGAAALLSLLFGPTKPGAFRIAPRDIRYFIGTGVVSFLLFSWCYFRCIQTSSLAVAATLLYTGPTFVTVLSVLLWKEPVTRRKLLALAMTFLGCALVAGIFDARLNLSGLVFGFGSGFCYALYSIFGRYALAKYSVETVTLWTFLCAAAGSLVFLLRPAELALLAQPRTLLLALGLAALSTVAPFLLYTKGLSAVSSSHAAILATIEPVVAVLVSVLVFGEALTLPAAAGVALILAAVVILR
ncbi:MAG TPA: EamA family transporter [Oscillospiraceae bacterium]|nr:EamA family transporter [Oscillospiraceae bacterium]